jgi:alpha-1,2-mannosyltransferase
MGKPRWYEYLLGLGLICLLAGVGYLSFERGNRALFDFRHFYLDARYVWEHGELNPNLDEQVPPDERRQLPFYLPAVPLALSPLTAFGRGTCAAAWALGQMAALGFSLYVLWQWCRRDTARAPAAGAFGVALLLAIPAFLEAAKFNQLSYFVLALILGAMAALDRERPRTAGALLGVAAVLKLLPGIFLIWLLLKRRWSAAVTFVVVALAVALGPPLAVFGPQKTAEYHRQWWVYNAQGNAAQGLLKADLAEHFIDRRNQSIAQVLARLTWSEHPYAAPTQLVHLDPQTCARLAYGITAILLAALLWVTRRPWDVLTVRRRHAEAAVYAIGMLVFSPLLRQYYLVWAIPALVLLARIAVDNRTVLPGVPSQRLGQISMAIWALGMAAWAWRIARVLGAHLLMLIIVGVLLLWATNESPVRPRVRPDRPA